MQPKMVWQEGEPKNKNTTHFNNGEEIGSVAYELFGNMNETGPATIMVPGMLGDIETYRSFCEALHSNGLEGVALLDKVSRASPFEHLRRGILPATTEQEDYWAEGTIAVLKQLQLEDRPVNLVGHSVGSQAIYRALEIAKDDPEIKSFDPELGGQVVLIAPSGSVKSENLLSLVGRTVHSGRLSKTISDAMGVPHVDENRERNLWRDPIISAREAWRFGRQEIDYKQLGSYGLRTTVVFYPDDRLFPFDKVEPSLRDGINGLANLRVITPFDTSVHNKTEFTSARKAQHSDLLMNPARTAKAVVEILQSIL